MGSYGGHVLPGTFFVIFGFWYVFKYTYCYLRGKSSLKNTVFHCCCQTIPFSGLAIEGIVKIVMISIGVLIELYYPGNPQGKLYGPDGNFIGAMNWQHSTMYFFFGLSGAADIICVSAQHVIFLGFDRLAAALALFIEGYLFYFHLHGRSLIDTRVHILLVLSIWPGALFTFLQCFVMKKRTLLHIFEMIMSTFIIIQGVWFWQAAYILYPPNGISWDPCSSVVHGKHLPENEIHGNDCNSVHEAEINLMFVTLFWTWIVAGVICFIAFIYFIAYQLLKCLGKLDPSLLTRITSFKEAEGRKFQPLLLDDDTTM